MNLVIKRLTPELIEDFLNYFDHVGFTDHPEWAGCYCLESHISEQEEGELKPLGIPGRREKSKELVLSGVMQGYLAYDDGKVVGWCNSGTKSSYCRICRDTASQEEAKDIKIVYCFDIAPDYRGRGIASEMLQRVCEDAKQEGFTYIEGCPWKEDMGIYNYHGPMKLYEKFGFKRYSETDKFYVMRREL